jgi:hypothetical protein
MGAGCLCACITTAENVCVVCRERNTESCNTIFPVVVQLQNPRGQEWYTLYQAMFVNMLFELLLTAASKATRTLRQCTLHRQHSFEHLRHQPLCAPLKREIIMLQGNAHVCVQNTIMREAQRQLPLGPKLRAHNGRCMMTRHIPCDVCCKAITASTLQHMRIAHREQGT